MTSPNRDPPKLMKDIMLSHISKYCLAINELCLLLHIKSVCA
jgi:hypothetical protein